MIWHSSRLNPYRCQPASTTTASNQCLISHTTPVSPIITQPLLSTHSLAHSGNTNKCYWPWGEALCVSNNAPLLHSIALGCIDIGSCHFCQCRDVGYYLVSHYVIPCISGPLTGCSYLATGETCSRWSQTAFWQIDVLGFKINWS